MEDATRSVTGVIPTCPGEFQITEHPPPSLAWSRGGLRSTGVTRRRSSKTLSGVLRETYENCDADVLFYDIEGMDHAWPLHEAKGPGAALIAEYAEVDYLDEAIRFFAEHPLP